MQSAYSEIKEDLEAALNLLNDGWAMRTENFHGNVPNPSSEFIECLVRARNGIDAILREFSPAVEAGHCGDCRSWLNGKCTAGARMSPKAANSACDL